jgi:hypothetical protein
MREKNGEMVGKTEEGFLRDLPKYYILTTPNS